MSNQVARRRKRVPRNCHSIMLARLRHNHHRVGRERIHISMHGIGTFCGRSFFFQAPPRREAILSLKKVYEYPIVREQFFCRPIGPHVAADLQRRFTGVVRPYSSSISGRRSKRANRDDDAVVERKASDNLRTTDRIVECDA